MNRKCVTAIWLTSLLFHLFSTTPSQITRGDRANGGKWRTCWCTQNNLSIETQIQYNQTSAGAPISSGTWTRLKARSGIHRLTVPTRLKFKIWHQSDLNDWNIAISRKSKMASKIQDGQQNLNFFQLCHIFDLYQA